MDSFTFDEHAAASAVLNMNQIETKRGAEGDDAAGMNRPAKLTRTEEMTEGVRTVAVPKPKQQTASESLELKPYPWFSYRDFSQEQDPDPLTPLTPPGRVPNFPAKMTAILATPEFSDIVAWLPHGRAWRILKPREFEIKVIPKFFEHAKFSSFVRQVRWPWSSPQNRQLQYP